MSSQDSSRHPQPTSSPDSYSVGLGPNLLSFANKSSDPAQSYSASFASKQSQWSTGGAGGGGGGEWNRPQGASNTSSARGNTGTGWGAFSSTQAGRAAWNAAPSSDKQQQHDSSPPASHHSAAGNGSSSASELNGSHDYNSMLDPDSSAASHSPSSAADYSQQQNGGWDGHSHASDAASAWSTNARSGAAASWDSSNLPSAASHSDPSADAWKQKSSVPSAASAAYSRPLATAASAAPPASSNNAPPSSYRPADFGDLYLDPARPTIWCYKDPQGEIQGPFDEESMRAWYNNRFFDLKLPVQCSNDDRPNAALPFIPLGVWFLHNKKAFLDQPVEIGQVNKAAEKERGAEREGDQLVSSLLDDGDDEAYKRSANSLHSQHQPAANTAASSWSQYSQPRAAQSQSQPAVNPYASSYSSWDQSSPHARLPSQSAYGGVGNGWNGALQSSTNRSYYPQTAQSGLTAFASQQPQRSAAYVAPQQQAQTQQQWYGQQQQHRGNYGGASAGVATAAAGSFGALNQQQLIQQQLQLLQHQQQQQRTNPSHLHQQQALALQQLQMQQAAALQAAQQQQNLLKQQQQLKQMQLIQQQQQQQQQRQQALYGQQPLSSPVAYGQSYPFKADELIADLHAATPSFSSLADLQQQQQQPQSQLSHFQQHAASNVLAGLTQSTPQQHFSPPRPAASSLLDQPAAHAASTVEQERSEAEIAQGVEDVILDDEAAYVADDKADTRADSQQQQQARAQQQPVVQSAEVTPSPSNVPSVSNSSPAAPPAPTPAVSSLAPWARIASKTSTPREQQPATAPPTSPPPSHAKHEEEKQESAHEPEHAAAEEKTEFKTATSFAAAAAAPSAQPAPSLPPWSTKPLPAAPVKSLKEIQQEEEARAQQSHSRRHGAAAAGGAMTVDLDALPSSTLSPSIKLITPIQPVTATTGQTQAKGAGSNKGSKKEDAVKLIPASTNAANAAATTAAGSSAGSKSLSSTAPIPISAWGKLPTSVSAAASSASLTPAASQSLPVVSEPKPILSIVPKSMESSFQSKLAGQIRVLDAEESAAAAERIRRNAENAKKQQAAAGSSTISIAPLPLNNGNAKGKAEKGDGEGEKRSERRKQDKDSAASKPASHPTGSAHHSAPSSATSSPSSAHNNAFGGAPMSSEFESWCLEHLTPLTHSSDLSLPHYLMTLDSPADIREYIYEYLGSSAGVQQFADGFIAMKEFETGQEKVKGGKAGPADKAAATGKEKEKVVDDEADAGGDEKKSRRRRRRKNEEF